MSNKDLVARARAMLTADDVDTKDMLAMVGELLDEVEAMLSALDAKYAAVKESLTTGEQPVADDAAEEIEAIASCLEYDASALRAEGFCEIPDNMDDAAALIRRLAARQPASPPVAVPAIIFDGYKVFKEAEATCLGMQAHHVTHVLDVVARHAKEDAAKQSVVRDSLITGHAKPCWCDECHKAMLAAQRQGGE